MEDISKSMFLAHKQIAIHWLSCKRHKGDEWGVAIIDNTQREKLIYKYRGCYTFLEILSEWMESKNRGIIKNKK